MTTTEKFVLAIDQGTTSTRAIIFNHSGEIVSVGQQEFTQIFPNPGWVEHNPIEIWDTTRTVVAEALQKAEINRHNLAAVGITNQRETTVVWDKNTGEPVYNAIVWQDMRTSDIVKELEGDEGPDRFRQICGLGLSPYFSGSKIKWLLDNVPGARERAEAGELLFGTIDTWLIWKLTGGRVHVTDHTNASRTMLFNIHELCWDSELLKLLDIPECILPEVKPSSAVYGKTEFELYGGEIPIAGAAGDQQCALFGQCCFEPGEMKNTYGTGCFLLMNTGRKPVASTNGLVTTIAVGFADHVEYALEGSIFVAGAAIQWLRDELGVISSAGESQQYAEAVADTAGAYVVPAFTGLGAPYWNQRARGAILGVTRGFGRAHLVRATLESLAYQTCDIARAMEQDSGIKIAKLKVDGGACANDFLMQFQSDLIGCDVVRPSCIETTALGAAYLAGLAVGYWQDVDDIRANWAVDKVFFPVMDGQKRDALLRGWSRAVKCALAWADDGE